MQFLRKHIFWVLLLALVLRLFGVTYGFPLFLVKDEPTLVYGALKMAELKTLIPALYQEEFSKVLYYPPAPSYFYLAALSPMIGLHYLFSGAGSIAEYKDLLAIDPSFIWIAARVLVVLLGVLNIFTVYLLTKRIFKSELSGIFAALFLTVSFYHLQLSHVVRHWIFATVLIYLIWLFAAKIAESGGGMKTYLLAGAALGISVGGVNTASIVAVIPFVLAHLFSPSDTSFLKKLVDKKFVFSLFVFLFIALVFVLLYPYGFTRAEGAAGPAADLSQRIYGLSQKSFSGFIDFSIFYIKLFTRYESILFLLSLAGLILTATKKNWWMFFSAFFYIFSYFALLYLFFNPIPRGLIFVLPLFAVFAGYTVGRLWEELKRRASWYFEISKYRMLNRYGAAFLFLAIIFGGQFAGDLRYDWLILQPDTRIEARNWVFKNIPENAKILVDSQYLRFINTKDGIQELERIDSAALRAADRSLLGIPDEHYPRPAYHMLNLHFISGDMPEKNYIDPKIFTSQGFRYFIVEYDYTDRRDLSRQAKAFISNARLVERFDNMPSVNFSTALDVGGEIATVSLSDLFRIRRLGKIVDVYEF